MKEKPTLFQLRRSYNSKTETLITTKQLAETSGVALADVFQMELGRPIRLEDAHKVLHAFSRLTGKRIDINDITVLIKNEEQPVPTWFGLKM